MDRPELCARVKLEPAHNDSPPRVDLELFVELAGEQLSTFLISSWRAVDTRVYAMKLGEVVTRLELLADLQVVAGAP